MNETNKSSFWLKTFLWVIWFAHATFFVLALVEFLPDIDYLNIRTYWIVYMVFSLLTLVVYVAVLVTNAVKWKMDNSFYRVGLPCSLVAYAAAGIFVCIILGTYSSNYRLHNEKDIIDYYLTLADYQERDSVYTDMLLKFTNAVSAVILSTMIAVGFNLGVLLFSREKELKKEHDN